MVVECIFVILKKTREMKGHWTEEFDWVVHTTNNLSGLTPEFASGLFRLYDNVNNHLKFLKKQAEEQPRFVKTIREIVLKKDHAQTSPKYTGMTEEGQIREAFDGRR